MVRLIFLLVAATLADRVIAQDDSATSVIASGLTITVIDSVDVPSMIAGRLDRRMVREGDVVQKGQPLAYLDDGEAEMNESLARTQWRIAQARAEDETAIQLAKMHWIARQQEAKEHSIQRQIADRKAANDVRIRAAEKTEAVAKNELDRALQSRKEFSQSVSQSEIDSLRLAYEKTRLETQQAKIEREIDELGANAEGEAAIAHRMRVDQARVQVDAAESQSNVLALQVQLEKQQTELATLVRENHTIVAPIDGVVAQMHRGIGDWLLQGQAVLRLIRLNRLRAEGFVPLGQRSQLHLGQQVEAMIDVGGDQVIRRDAEVVFISPEVDPVTKEVRFWVELDNPETDILPGMRLSVRAK